jgi:hypothetical protein
MKTLMVRIRLEDYKKIKKVFPSWKGETAASYFYRLRIFLQEMKK